jgi:hypothetical protein
MTPSDIDKQIEELRAMKARLVVRGPLRPIDDDNLQLLGLVAADAARLGRIVPAVPVWNDTGETARILLASARIEVGDRLTAVPPFRGRWEVAAEGGEELAAYIRTWGGKVRIEGGIVRGKA